MLKMLFFRFLRSLKPPVATSSLAEALSVLVPFKQSEIAAIHEKAGSWDMVLATCGYAALNGLAFLHQAYFQMLQEHPHLDAHTLYKMYGVM